MKHICKKKLPQREQKYTANCYIPVLIVVQLGFPLANIIYKYSQMRSSSLLDVADRMLKSWCVCYVHKFATLVDVGRMLKSQER